MKTVTLRALINLVAAAIKALLRRIGTAAAPGEIDEMTSYGNNKETILLGVDDK